MKYLLISFSISIICFSCTTNRTRVIKFEYTGKNCLEENIIRIYLNDSIFINYSNTVLSSNESVNRIDTFKVVNGKWYIKKCGIFKIYFDLSGFEKGDTIFLYDNDCNAFLKRIPQKKTIVNNKPLFEYKVEEQHYNYFAPSIWFDPDYGVVKIEAPTSNCEIKNLKIVSDELLNQKEIKRLIFGN